MKDRPPDDDVVYLEEDDGRDDVARALREAERAVSAVEERHRHHEAPPDESAHPAAVEALERELADLRQRAAAAEEETGKMREVLLRKTADFENLKRRTEREKTEYFKFALAEAFRDLLGVLDNFQRAMAHAEGPAGEFRAGIEMIERQLSDVLRKYGLVEVSALGQPFDPNFHEAVVREETDAAPPGTVVEVLQRGYTLNDRLLRPAMVKVAAAPTSR